MSLSAFSLNVNVGFTLVKTHSLFQSSGYPAGGTPDSYSWPAAQAALTTYNQVLARIDTLAASASLDIDVSAYTNLADEAVTLAKAVAILLLPTGGAGGVLKYTPGTATALTWFLSGTTPGISVPSGGILLVGYPLSGAGQTVDSMHKKINIANTGSVSLSCLTILLGGT